MQITNSITPLYLNNSKRSDRSNTSFGMKYLGQAIFEIPEKVRLSDDVLKEFEEFLSKHEIKFELSPGILTEWKGRLLTKYGGEVWYRTDYSSSRISGGGGDREQVLSSMIKKINGRPLDIYGNPVFSMKQ